MALVLSQPKAVRDGYSPSPFFFAQTNEGGAVRLVAWTSSLRGQRRVFEELVRLLPERVEILLNVKVDDGDSEYEAGSMSPRWQRHHGIVTTGALLEAMARCEAFVFRDSRSQLFVRDPHSLEYIVFDDDGVIYVYSGDERFRDVLARSGFQERIEELIGRAGWWGQFPPNGPDHEAEFLRLLRLVAVPGPGEPHDPDTLH